MQAHLLYNSVSTTTIHGVTSQKKIILIFPFCVLCLFKANYKRASTFPKHSNYNLEAVRPWTYNANINSAIQGNAS